MNKRLALVTTAFALGVLSCLPRVAFGWFDAGHMAIAQIAYGHLTPRTKEAVNQLIALSAEPDSGDFITAACWADDIKKRGDHAHDSEHYIDYPFSTNGTPTPAKLNPANVVSALERCVKVLKNAKASDESKATSLRFLMHFVGDIHQPLHCVSRYTRELPNGDRGGNEFRIIYRNGSNLHFLWDGGCGLLPKIQRPVTESGREAIKTLVAELLQKYPPDKMKDLHEKNFRKWASESFALARDLCYNLQENAEPPSSYLKLGREATAKRLILAGFRLADILNNIFDAKESAEVLHVS